MNARKFFTSVVFALAAITALFGAVRVWAQRAAASDDTVPSIAKAIKNSNEIYLGWRVFQGNCSRCHGPDATGTANAPNLLERVKPMTLASFIGTVLRRYRWLLPASEASAESGSPEVLLEGIAERQRGTLVMPAWQNEPAVKAHVADLYDYLQARARGDLPPGRPPRLTGK